MHPQTGESLNEEAIANKVVGTMTDKRSSVWVIKKMNDGLEMAAWLRVGHQFKITRG